MKRYWLTIMTALLLALCLPLMGGAAEGMMEETAEPALDTQIFLLPKITQDYREKDTQDHFVSILKDVVGPLTMEENRQVVLFPAKNNKAPEIGQTVDFRSPYAVVEPAQWLQQICDTDHLDAKRNIVIAIEGRNLQREAEISADWAMLKQLAEMDDVDVYMISLSTGRNESGMRALAAWLSDGQMPETSASENSVVDLTDSLHLIRVTDYSQALQALMPLTEKLTGRTYTQVQADEAGTYSLFAYAGLTRQQVLLVESSEQVQLTVVNQNGDAVNCEMITASNALQAVVLPDDATVMNVTVEGKHGAVYWGYQYETLDGLKLELQSLERKNTFARNEQSGFYASLMGMELSKLVESMNGRGVVCELINGETMETLAVMDYSAERNFFYTDYAFTQPAEQMPMRIRIRLDDGLELLSEPYMVQITNTAPVLSVQNEPLYWIADPWKQVASLKIPLTVTDAENDEVKLELVDLESGVVAGLGTITVNDAEKCLEISLFAEPILGEEFSINVRCSDGVTCSETCEVSFTLYSLTEALQQMQNGAVLTLEGDHQLKKYQEVMAHVTLAFPEDMPEMWQTALKQVICERMEAKMTIVPSSPDAEMTEMTMTASDDGWQAVCSMTVADNYQVTAALVSDWGNWTIAAQPVEITVAGSRPEIADATYPAQQKLVIPEPEEEQEAGYWLQDIVPNQLFRDEDGDEIVMTATLVQLVRGVPQDETMTAQSTGDQMLSMCIAQPGQYELHLVAADNDGRSEEIISTLYVLTYRQQLVVYALLGAIALLMAVLLIRLLVYLVKPSFKDKVIEVTVNSTHWCRTARISTNAWKKKAQPLNVLLLCAACPPDGVLYDAANGCTIKPQRRGIVLLKGENLNLEKKCRIAVGENATASVGQYAITLTVCEAETAAKGMQG